MEWVNIYIEGHPGRHSGHQQKNPAQLGRVSKSANDLETSVSTTAVTITGSTKGAFFAGLGGIDSQRASANFFSMKHADGLLGIRLGTHCDEGETLGGSRIAILDDIYGDYTAGFGEHSAQLFLGCIITHITYVQFNFQLFSSTFECSDSG